LRGAKKLLNLQKNKFNKIFNLLGECVMSTGGAVRTHPLIPSQKGNVRIDVSGLPAGVYIVRLGDWEVRFLKI
jgi:hypothetical protein